MKIGILTIGKVDSNVISRIQKNLHMIFPHSTCMLIAKTQPIPEETFNRTRRQYNSNHILRKIHNYAEKDKNMDRVLGIVNADIFVPNLSYVFGEAECPGKAALISLWRLRAEFYGKPSNNELFLERITKESVHELGHTLGLGHCPNPYCVMYFSNSIFETDRKQSLFCSKCYLEVEKTVDSIGRKP